MKRQENQQPILKKQCMQLNREFSKDKWLETMWYAHKGQEISKKP